AGRGVVRGLGCTHRRSIYQRQILIGRGCGLAAPANWRTQHLPNALLAGGSVRQLAGTGSANWGRGAGGTSIGDLSVRQLTRGRLGAPPIGERGRRQFASFACARNNTGMTTHTLPASGTQTPATTT